MILLPKEAVEEYQKIYQDIYGKKISYTNALEGGIKLLRLFKLIYHPLPKEWVEEIEKEKGDKKQ